MPIESIVIVISPARGVPDKDNRVLTFERETKQWVSNEGGLFSGEIKLIADINAARDRNVV